MEKAFEDIAAEYESETSLICFTPNFEDYGPKKVAVYVSVNKLDFTITKASYQYYLNTKGENCLAFGPGLLSENAIGETTVTIIQAKNKNNFGRESGADQFVITVRDFTLSEQARLKQKAQEEERQLEV